MERPDERVTLEPRVTRGRENFGGAIILGPHGIRKDGGALFSASLVTRPLLILGSLRASISPSHVIILREGRSISLFFLPFLFFFLPQR